MPGVLKFVTAKDIPGVNNFVGAFESNEKIFCDGEVDYAGQGVGVIIAGKMLLLLLLFVFVCLFACFFLIR
jgi:xanthine dehydrogenase molybdopterin-binding subunit B